MTTQREAPRFNAARFFLAMPVVFAVFVCAMFVLALVGRSEKKVVTAEQQRIEQLFSSAKPGDLMIMQNGTVCVLGQARAFAVRKFSGSLEVNYVCGFSWNKPTERFVTEQLDAKSTIAHIGEKAHSDAASCFVQGLKYNNGSCSQ